EVRMNQEVLDAIAAIITKALVDIALIVIPVVGAFAANALHNFASDKRTNNWLTTHRLFETAARQAVLAVEQTMINQPAQEKKQTALARALAGLNAQHVPVTAEMLAALDDAIEAQVLLWLKAAKVELYKAAPSPATA